MSTIVSPGGMKGVRSVGQRRLKDRCEIVRAKSNSSAFGGGGAKGYQVAGCYACDVVARSQSRDDSENQNRQTGLFDVHLPLGAVWRLSDRFWLPGYIPEWRPGFFYSKGAYATPPLGSGVGDGFFYICLQDGASGTVSPFGEKSVLGHRAPDGGTAWKRAGRLIVLEPVADELPNHSNAGSLTVVCKVVT